MRRILEQGLLGLEGHRAEVVAFSIHRERLGLIVANDVHVSRQPLRHVVEEVQIVEAVGVGLGGIDGEDGIDAVQAAQVYCQRIGRHLQHLIVAEGQGFHLLVCRPVGVCTLPDFESSAGNRSTYHVYLYAVFLVFLRHGGEYVFEVPGDGLSRLQLVAKIVKPRISPLVTAEPRRDVQLNAVTAPASPLQPPADDGVVVLIGQGGRSRYPEVRQIAVEDISVGSLLKHIQLDAPADLRSHIVADVDAQAEEFRLPILFNEGQVVMGRLAEHHLQHHVFRLTSRHLDSRKPDDIVPHLASAGISGIAPAHIVFRAVVGDLHVQPLNPLGPAVTFYPRLAKDEVVGRVGHAGSDCRQQSSQQAYQTEYQTEFLHIVSVFRVPHYYLLSHDLPGSALFPQDIHGVALGLLPALPRERP